MTTLVGIVVLLGGLIFFHELGHYLVAKFFGVRVEVFSLGFGKKLLRKTIGETEYCVSAFPLGGYVKLMGDDPYKGVPAEEAHRAFSTQKLYKRFLIVAAGPFANLLLAYVLFVVVFWFGQKVPSGRIGSVVVASPAWTAGLRAGDRITSVGSEPVKFWTDIETLLRDRADQTLDIRLERKGSELSVPVSISLVETKNEFGEDILVGGLKGVSPIPQASAIGISNPKSAAYLAGLRTGDTITKIGNRSVEAYEEIHHVLDEIWTSNAPITISVKRPLVEGGKAHEEKYSEHSFSVVPTGSKPKPEQLTPFGLGQALGIYPSELFVKSISSGTPAEKAGLSADDRIAKVDGVAVYNFEAIVDEVQEGGKKQQAVTFSVERQGQEVILSIVPTETEQEHPITRQKYKKFLVGFLSQKAYGKLDLVPFKIREPVALLAHAGAETFGKAKVMLLSLGKLVVGKISVKNLGGPVLIASVAGESLDLGIIPFLMMMALISINLFLLNLFPIPILDGGHLLFFAIEALKGKPVSIRTMEIANRMGMAFILTLVLVTLYNDITRMVAP